MEAWAASAPVVGDGTREPHRSGMEISLEANSSGLIVQGDITDAETAAQEVSGELVNGFQEGERSP